MASRSLALVIVLSACGSSYAGLRNPEIPEGWIVERPELATLFPEGEPRSISERWSKSAGTWQHCYEVEAPMREGERERFARAAETLGYRVGETTMGEQPAFSSGGVSATQSLPSEGAGALFEALGEAITEGAVPTVTVRVCVTRT